MPDAPRPDVPRRLGGYRVVQELGRGGMGTAFLARQVALGRDVALKVMRPEWARNAPFVARFTREAYAASLLSHPNLVQIYDFGQDKGTTYVTTEFVDGGSLAGLVRQRTRLDAREAAGYVLQAARGLKYAHDQGMTHGDVTPANVLLDRQGVVKVADLGLVKTPEVAAAEAAAAATTAAGGGPAATGAGPGDRAVGPRADIASLGRVLSHLVTGRPAVEGRNAVEGVPRELSAIVLKMTAERPEDRYRDLGEVITALEGFLGLPGAGVFTPHEEDARLLDESVRAFNASHSARVRSLIVLGFLAGCALLAVLCLLTRRPVSAVAFLGLGLMTALADFVVGGLRKPSALFHKARELAAGTPPNEWLLVLAGVVVGLIALWVFKLFWAWFVLAVVAVGIAVGLRMTLDRQAEAERAGPLGQVEALVRSLRLQGLDEDALRQFVCQYGGDRWEELFEALFGYEAKLDARRRWGLGERGRPRLRFAPWRDPVAAWLDARVDDRRREKARATLQAIEERALVAQGVNEMTARRKARRTAEAVVAVASEIRESVNRRDDTIPVNRAIARSLHEAAAQPETVLVDRERGLLEEDRRFRPADLLDWVLGPKPRFLAGAALLAGCLAWMHQNDLLNAEQAETLKAATTRAVEAVQKGDTKALETEAKAVAARAVKATENLKLPFLPAQLTALVSSFGAGAGGLILIASSFFRGSKMALFAVPAAAVPVLGPKLGLPAIGPLDPSFAPSVVGAAILAAGVLFGRSRR
jgi:hypothetical protein